MISNDEEGFITHSLETCQNSSLTAPNTMASYMSARSVAIVFFRSRLARDALTGRSVRSTPSRTLFTPHPTTRKKMPRKSPNLYQPHSFSTPTLSRSWFPWKKIRRARPTPKSASCTRVSQVLEFKGEVFTYTWEDCMSVLFEYLKDKDRYVHSVLSHVKPIKPLTEEQHRACQG